MKDKKNLRFMARIVSMLLVIVLLSESALGSGNVVLASMIEENIISEERNDDETKSEVVEDDHEQTDETEETYKTEDLEILFELEENRDQSSKHFRLSDGSIMAADYGMDIHYQKDGDWKDIDNRFVYEAADTADAMEGFATAEGDVEFKFAPDIVSGEVVKVQSSGYLVGFEFLGAVSGYEILEEETAGDIPKPFIKGRLPETEAVPLTFVRGDVLNKDEALSALKDTVAEASVLALVADDVQVVGASSYLTGESAGVGEANISDAASLENEEDIWAEAGTEDMDISEEDSLMKKAALANAVTSVGYENVLDGVSLQYVAAGSSLKEYILVSEPQESYEYLFAMNLENLVPASQSDGSILLLDTENGETVYEIPEAYMTDAAGGYSDDVSMELTQVDAGEYHLRISASKEWLSDDERVFPIKIDPTLNKKLTSSANVRGNYVEQGHPNASSTNYGEMYVGYDSSGNKNMITYIQLRNLPVLPADSVVCSSVFNMAVLSFSQVAWPRLTIQAREVKNTSWSSAYTWNSRPSSESIVIDHKTITSSDLYKYVGWDITSLVKEHYDAGNKKDEILAFSLEAYGTMANLKCANTALNLKWDGAEPLFQIFYRDSRGVEDYYTYQNQSLGNAGIGYISDYSSQLVVAKTIASYDATDTPFSIGLVYNSANSGKYFSTDSEIHTTDFSAMNSGTGWKLTLQETVVPINITDVDGTTAYLVYNDADGTEHYFRRSESDSSKYEDEDGLNLTIRKKTVNSVVTYEMTDKKDNKKTFTNGYLTCIEDASHNKINIVYHTTADGKKQLSSVNVHPNGGTQKEIYSFTFLGQVNTLFQITDYAGRAFRFTYLQDKNGRYQLNQVIRYDASNTASPNTVEARYLYDAASLRLTHAYDVETKSGVQYTYYKGDTGYRVYDYWEYTSPSVEGTQTTGAKARAWSQRMRNTRYRFSGADGQIDTADDIVNTYLFNSAGQTVGARSELESARTLLGVTASAYTKNSGTSSQNNRMNSSISSGQSGISLLLNGGMEKAGDTETAADSWTASISNGNAARKTDGITTGLSHSGKCYYNLWGADNTGAVSLYQDKTVKKGETYTFSAYVNTKELSGKGTDAGVYLYATQLSDQKLLGKSILLDYVTDQNLDKGYQRLTVSFTASADASVRFTICSYHVHGTIRVDDVQVEKSSAASRYNQLYNGSFERADSKIGWDTQGNGTITVTDEAGGVKHGNISLKMTATAPEATLCAYQTIDLYKSSNTTFLLSGWGRANSVPGFAEEIEGKNDNTLKYWGIVLTLNYADGTAPEHFHLLFCDYVTDWQYAAMSITPKTENANKIITTAVIRLYYKNNANTAYFDSISLIEEPAQTYKYDKDGNLVSVKSSGNGEDAFEFKEGTMDLTKTCTEGSGDYKYEYPETGNTHLPVRIINDTVTMHIDYDATGRTTQTTLKDNTGGSPLTMVSTAQYQDGLLKKVTDNTEASTTYGYDSRRRAKLVTDAAGTETRTSYDDIWDRAVQSYQSGVISVANTYADGNLTEIKRGGYVMPGGTKQEQKYLFAYDSFGRNTSVSVGAYRIADYHYNPAGSLTRIDYGYTDTPQAVASYSYDELDRVKEVSYYNNKTNETVRYGYLYSSDGNLSGITKNGELQYVYDYDTLGRLIHSSMLENGKITLYTGHKYDTSDRILSQNWQIGSDGFTETYSYNEKDGTLNQMTTGGDTLTFGYDALKRLNKRTSSCLTLGYSYRDISSTKTTTQVSQISYKNGSGTSEVLPALGYTYDALGNIKTVSSGGTLKQSYVYDEQNQLASEIVRGLNGGNHYGTYTYDTYGNIRKIEKSLSGVEYEKYELEYGNASWLDLLTRVTYTDDDGNVSTDTLTYDRIGNPLTYFNGHEKWNFTWKFGRQLTNASSGSKAVSYTYDMDGIRQSKTVNGNTTKYTTLDGKVVRETNGNVKTDYFYDNEGKPYKIVVKNNTSTYTGYYALNQQGDVIAILDDTGNVAVRYEYNAWGRILSETGTNTVAGTYLKAYNNLKYRGYYYDAETGFYYLCSRYYDPVIGRFINSDTLDIVSLTPVSIKNKNLYFYCDNNPVNNRDSEGTIVETVFDVVSLAGSIVEVASRPTDPWAWASLIGDVVDMIPVVSGCGESIKVLKTAAKVSDEAKTVGKIARKRWKVGDPIDALTQAGNVPSWSTIRQRFWKNLGQELEDKLDEKTYKRLKRGLAPLDDTQSSLHLHHPKGRKTPEDYFTFAPVTPKEHFEWHMKYGF